LSKDEGDRKRKYREFVRGMIKDKDAMKGEMSRWVVYGSEGLIKKVEKEYKVGAVIRHRGRPLSAEL